MSETSHVPFFDLTRQTRELESEFLEMFRGTLNTCRFIGGPEVEGFENEFATYVGVREAVGVGSGTEALRLAFLALGVKPGDEIVTVPNTFIATTEAISQVGAKIVFTDVDPQTSNMAPEGLEGVLTEKTKLIVPVHLYGRTADMDPILEIARKRGIKVLEDAAQAQGSRYKGRMAGSFGDAATFSFYPGKNLGALGEAGAVVTNDPAIANEVRILRDHGQPEKYRHRVEGTNGRLDAIQAGALRIKLRHLDRWNESRRQIANWYDEGLRDVAGIETPMRDENLVENHHIYIAHTPFRDELREGLQERGVHTALHYPIPLHLQEAYANQGWKEGDFPVTESLAQRLVSLPMFPELTQSEVETVCQEVQRVLATIAEPVGV